MHFDNVVTARRTEFPSRRQHWFLADRTVALKLPCVVRRLSSVRTSVCDVMYSIVANRCIASYCRIPTAKVTIGSL